jgi:hypothetical protein
MPPRRSSYNPDVQPANIVSGYALPENPGARWGYNDYAISLYCKTLFPKVFEQTMAAVVSARLGPLQFQDGAVIGSGGGGCQLFTSVRDAARIGWFWLNKGRWRVSKDCRSATSITTGRTRFRRPCRARLAVRSTTISALARPAATHQPGLPWPGALWLQLVVQPAQGKLAVRAG